MTSFRIIRLLGLVILLRDYTVGLQRPPPRYSQQYMPQTSFTCRNKIIGSYYADPETDCQLFHVCVSVAGSVQDYRFLCPNDTAFDQESQTCADWYDVDCEAATLYYASDNFDLYRIGSGLESLHYDNIRNEFEPQDHLQRSESNDPIRSPVNQLKSINFKDSKILKKDSHNLNDNRSSLLFKKQKEVSSEKQSNFQENKEDRKKLTRKINNKYDNYNLTSEYIKTTTLPFVVTENRSNGRITNKHLPTLTLGQVYQNMQSPQKLNQYASTIRPIENITPPMKLATVVRNTFNHHIEPSQLHISNNSNGLGRLETTFKLNHLINFSHPDLHGPKEQLDNLSSINNKKISQEYLISNQERNNGRKKFAFYDSNYNRNNEKINNVRIDHDSTSNLTSAYLINTTPNVYETKFRGNPNSDVNQFTKKIGDSSANTIAAATYALTTYSSVPKKLTDFKQFDKLTTFTTKSASHFETDVIKRVKTESHSNYHQNYETSPKNYRSEKPIELGFSPSSINYLAEHFKSSTSTRRNTTPTTYNPSNFGAHIYSPQTTQKKSAYNQNQSTKTISTSSQTAQETTTSKANRKNDYDYAYYDNGPLEYDNIELEQVDNNKESVKLT